MGAISWSDFLQSLLPNELRSDQGQRDEGQWDFVKLLYAFDADKRNSAGEWNYVLLRCDDGQRGWRVDGVYPSFRDSDCTRALRTNVDDDASLVQVEGWLSELMLESSCKTVLLAV